MKTISNVRRLAGVLVTAAMLSACAAAPTVYYKPGITNEGFSKDKYECLKENQVPYSTSSLYVGRYGGGGGSNSGVTTDIGMAKACMEGRGYHKVDPKNPPKVDKVDAPARSEVR